MYKRDLTEAEVRELIDGTFHNREEQKLFNAWVAGMHEGWNDACDRCERPDVKMDDAPALN